MNKAIKKIELDLGGKVVSLTPEQAKNLKEALDDLFSSKVIRVIEKEYLPSPAPYPMPYPVPVQPLRPYYWERTPWYYDRITCDSTTVACNSDTLRLTG